MTHLIELHRDEIEGHAALLYIPRTRGQPHYADSVSRAILAFHKRPRLDWANLCARLLRSALPMGADTLTFPPQAPDEDWSAGRTLAHALGRVSGVPCRELVFVQEPRRGGDVLCPTDLSGRPIVVVDDIWRTGASMVRCAAALKAQAPARSRR
ncbi:MAG: phosphoribosyltransferase [Armatimonadota bacterium]|nr:phosphoribosyltransferase [Armatimonadota bacterium]